ncbi:MAG: type VI secretion system baseplate subunit TssG [Maricaulaceae bacterium]
MAQTARRHRDRLAGALAEDAERFELFQAWRLLALAAKAKGGRVTLDAEARLERAKGEVNAADWSQARLNTAQLSTLGVGGALPWVYAETARIQARGDNPAMKAFLALFEQRLAELAYRIWETPQLGLRAERGDPFGLDALALCVMGAGDQASRAALTAGDPALNDTALSYFSGRLATGRGTAEDLSTILSALLGTPVAVRQALGGWIRRDGADTARLGESALDGANALGRYEYERAHSFELVIGPDDAVWADRMVGAGEDGLGPLAVSLCAVLRATLDQPFRVRVRLQGAAEAAPASLLSGAARLGINARVGQARSDEAVDLAVAWLQV